MNSDSKTPVFGSPLDDKPHAASKRTSTHWEEVADHCKRNPGKWFPVTIPDLSEGTHRTISYQIPQGYPKPFTEGMFDATYVDNQLYVKYNGKDEL